MYTLTIKSENIPSNFTGMVEWSNGGKVWYKDGELHRLDGPAVEFANGRKEWWKDGKLHRLDGPAYEGVDGTKAWFKDGKYLTESEFNASNNSSNEIPCEVVINGITYKLVKQA